jgi:hypothetical protein
VRTKTRSLVATVLLASIAVAACIKQEGKNDDNAAGLPPPSPPPPEPPRSAMAIDPNMKYAIVSAPSGKCVQSKSPSVEPSQIAEMAACDKSPAQQFTLRQMPGGYWTIVNALSHKCLDVPGVSSDDGAMVHQFLCNGGPNQDWIIADAVEGTVRLVARHSGKVLDVADGTQLVQTPWRAAPNQQFKLTTDAPLPAAKTATPTAGAYSKSRSNSKKGGKVKPP